MKANRWLTLSAVLAGAALLSGACVTEDDEGSPATHAGGAGGAAPGGAAPGGAPLGPELCGYYETNWELGTREAFAACVAGVGETPCDAAYTAGVRGCEDAITAQACESANATTVCATIDCSGGGARLNEGECEWYLNPYTDAAQSDIITNCYLTSGDDGTDNCADAFFNCL